MKNPNAFLFFASTLSIAIAAPGHAQEQDSSESAESAGEIIVTARKREESLQEVPLAITAFAAEDIEDAGIDNVEDIALLTPSFSFAQLLGGISSTPVIRGQATTIGEPNVGFFVDGVYQSSRNIMDAMLGDNVERIEVAKGPQNALYGRNTFAGAINFVTKKPGNELTGRLEASAGNGGHYEFRGNISGPIVEDRVLFQLGAAHSNTDGFFTNELTGGDMDTQESTIITGTLLLYPTDGFEIVARAGYDSTRDGDYPLRFQTNNASLANPTPAPIPPALQGFEGEIPSYDSGFAVTPGFNNHDNLTVSVSMEMDLGAVSFTSITGYNDLQIDTATDTDFEARSIRYATVGIDQRELSQELRLSSNGYGPFRWNLGAYYYNLDVETNNRDTFVDGALALSAGLQGTPLAGLLPPGVINVTNEGTESFAIFGSLAYEITDRLTATFEGRWTTETKDVRAVDTNPLTMAVSTFVQDATFDNFVPRFTLDYQATDSTLVYASAARAVKTGGFNVNTATGAVLPSERTYDPEKSWTYEVGLKNSLADGRVRLNLAGFYTEWTDQIVRALGATFAVLNANIGKSSIKGIEAELQASVTDGLDLSAGFAYLDASYDRYTFAALAGLGFDPVLDGTRLQYTSDVQLNASLQYVKPVVNDLNWKSRIDFSYQTDQSVVQTAQATVGDATIVNVRTGIEADSWDLTFWVENLLEEDSAVSGVFTPNQATRFDTAVSLATPGATPLGFQAFGGLGWSRTPRKWGATVRFKF